MSVILRTRAPAPTANKGLKLSVKGASSPAIVNATPSLKLKTTPQVQPIQNNYVGPSVFDYKRRDEIEHVYNPSTCDNYVGSDSPDPHNDWVFDIENYKIFWATITVSQAV